MNEDDHSVRPNGECGDADLTAEDLDDYALAGETGGEAGSGDGLERDPFFVSKKAAAVFKHALLNSYFPRFAGKAGSTETDKRLVYVDTHAGPGKYDDGTPGSPLLIAKSVTGMQSAPGASYRNIECMFIEARPVHHQKLTTVLHDNMPRQASWRARKGKASAHLDEALEFAGNSPLFMFIDPYGLGPSFDEVVKVLSRSRNGHGSKTEILLNFISMAFSRAGGFLKADIPTPQQLKTLARLDSVLGGCWWRDVYLGSESGGSAVGKLVREYATRICESINTRPKWKQQKCRATLIPVRNTTNQDVPIYWLVHFTFHPHGKWCIAEAAAKANQIWRQTNHELTLNKLLAREAHTSQVDLFNGTLVPHITEEEHARTEDEFQENWTNIIIANLRRLINSRAQLSVCEDMTDIFGVTLGLAQGKHLRKAWDILADEGALIRRKPGQLENQLIHRTLAWRRVI